MKKLNHILVCAFVLFFSYAFNGNVKAQQPTWESYSGYMSAANSIMYKALGAMCHANYVANAANNAGNSQHLNSRLNSLSVALAGMQSNIATLQSIPNTLASPGLLEEISNIVNAHSLATSALNACINSFTSGAPVPGAAANTVRDMLLALKNAGPCIRREIQEIV